MNLNTGQLPTYKSLFPVRRTQTTCEEAKMFTMKFMKRFIDDDNDPDIIENGYTFYNKEVIVRLESIKESTKEKFKEFLLKIHTINMT
jgi:hypothetical protein